MLQTSVEVDRFVPHLRVLIETCGPNKHDQAIAAITALIEEGVTGRRDIIRILVRLGFNRAHIIILLDQCTGNDPVANYWRQDADGQLHVHG